MRRSIAGPAIALALVAALAAALLVVALTPDAFGRPRPEKPRTAAQVEAMHDDAQACRHGLGQPSWPTRRDWERTTSTQYMAWVYERWAGRLQDCNWQTRRANSDARYAIRLIFTGPGDPSHPHAASASEQAIRVAYCESRWTFTHTPTGQYVGAFQLGNSERAQYGLGIYASREPHTAVTASGVLQVRSAFRMFNAAGRSWGRWQCQPGQGGETSYWFQW